MVSVGDMNPFASIEMGSLALGLMIFFGALLIISLVGVLIFLYVNNKKLKYTIPLKKRVGNETLRIGIFRAKDFKIGHAGDKLWYIPKAKKYINPATLQTAPNEYTHFEREDGEWINIADGDIDLTMKTQGVKYIQSDMRAGRIAISNILEQRFKGKQSFWEKYGNMITQAIFYLIVSVAMVIIFYQWGGIIDRTNELLAKIIAYEDLKCPAIQGVVPAFVMLMLRRNK